ncbi:MAG TPA: universal stress protein [Thermomicrobiales bacterium]|jgi:nucleotide-binding universal stress UspA family protein
MAAGGNLILVPISGAVVDERALDIAILMARRYHSVVTAIHVVEVPQQLPLEAEMGAEVERGDRILRAATEIAAQYGYELEVELLQARAAGPAIVDEALGRGARLIVMGAIIRRRAGEVTPGRTTVPYVLKNAPCEVVICRRARTNDE